LQPKTRIGETYLKIVNELSYNIWQGFLEGFYSEESHLRREKCFGEKTFENLKSALILTETTNKHSFFMNLAKVIRNMVDLALDVRENCKVT
jgi:hypothetical protein